METYLICELVPRQNKRKEVKFQRHICQSTYIALTDDSRGGKKSIILGSKKNKDRKKVIKFSLNEKAI